MVVPPDPPINLIKDSTITSEEIIRFTWSAPNHNGGRPILDYEVFWNAAGEYFLPLANTTNTYF